MSIEGQNLGLYFGGPTSPGFRSLVAYTNRRVKISVCIFGGPTSPGTSSLVAYTNKRGQNLSLYLAARLGLAAHRGFTVYVYRRTFRTTTGGWITRKKANKLIQRGRALAPWFCYRDLEDPAHAELDRSLAKFPGFTTAPTCTIA